MAMSEREIRQMSAEDLRDWVLELVEALNNLDEVDYFGQEGWRSMLMGE